MSDTISLVHGAGGIETLKIILELTKDVKLRKVIGGTGLDELDDSALIPISENKFLAITVDSYTVNPIFFPGGDIGKLAATGTINDIAVMGATPLAVLDSIVVEEGFDKDLLLKIMNSFKKVLEKENVALIGGDFKVMPKGSLDKIIISTVGVGIVDKKNLLLDSNVKPDDQIIISGSIGEHGAIILALQLGLDVSNLKSDCETVTDIMKTVLKIGGVHAAKDPTRGGLAMALNEFAKKSNVTIIVDEDKIPIKEEVRSYCEMLGVDPLALACEGRVVLAVKKSKAHEILKELHDMGYEDACIIGEVKKLEPGIVLMKSKVGGLRILEPPLGEIIPRIC